MCDVCFVGRDQKKICARVCSKHFSFLRRKRRKNKASSHVKRLRWRRRLYNYRPLGEDRFNSPVGDSLDRDVDRLARILTDRKRGEGGGFGGHNWPACPLDRTDDFSVRRAAAADNGQQDSRRTRKIPGKTPLAFSDPVLFLPSYLRAKVQGFLVSYGECKKNGILQWLDREERTH